MAFGPDAPAFTLNCPGRDSPGREVAAIRARGNLPLIIGGRVLAEIARADLYESWETAAHLEPAVIADMSRIAGRRLSDVLDENLDCADIVDIVTDAAVLFLLAMRRLGLRTPDEIRPCTLLWDEAVGRELVVMRA